jgi:hypothetical protein
VFTAPIVTATRFSSGQVALGDEMFLIGLAGALNAEAAQLIVPIYCLFTIAVRRDQLLQRRAWSD